MSGQTMDKLVVQICIERGQLVVTVFIEDQKSNELFLEVNYKKDLIKFDWPSIIPIIETHFDESRKLIEIRLCPELEYLRGEVTSSEQEYSNSLLSNPISNKIILTPNF